MNGIAHILSPMSAPWCGWTLFGLFLCAVFSEYMQPGIIRQAPLSLLAQTDRTYKDAPATFLGQTLLTIFRIGTLATAIYLSLYTEGVFRFVTFAAICGCTVAVLLVKMLCNRWLESTFQFSRHFAPFYEQYGDISTLATCLLYPGVLVTLYVGNITVGRWLLGIITILFLLMCLYRLTRHYVQSLSALLYVALYLCTLEILPLGILLYISSKTIISI